MNKNYDWFDVMISNPDLSVQDFSIAGINDTNTTLKDAINGNFYFTYNTEITNIKEAFKLEINLTISNSLKSILNLLIQIEETTSH